MQYRKMGRTNLDVSVIGFGASALGNVFGDVSPAACNQAVHAAIDNGINLFDVSPYSHANLFADE
jgi:L-galactose dehydrogenase